MALHLDARRIVVAGHMQRPNVQDHHAGDDKREEIVQRVEPVQRRLSHREPSPDPLHHRGPKPRDHRVQRREQVGDHGHRPEAHLPPDERIAHESRGDHQQQDEHAEYPQHLAWGLVGPIIEPAERMDEDGEEEHRRADLVGIAQQPAPVHVAHDLLNGIERTLRSRLIVHGQHDAGGDLRDQHEGEDAAERPQIVQVARRREDHELVMHQPRNRQTRIEPPLDAG